MMTLRRDPLGTLATVVQESEDVARVVRPRRGARRTVYFILHPDGVHRVLAGEADRYAKDGSGYGEVRRAIGNGLPMLLDVDWRPRRRLVQPLFTRQRIAGYAETMAHEVDETLGAWARAARDGRPVDASAEMTRLTIRVVCRILFSSDVERVLPVISEALPLLNAWVFRRTLTPIRIPRTWPVPANRRGLRAQQAIQDVCDQLIAARRAAETPGDDLLGLLLLASDGDSVLNDQQIRDEARIFLIAGHETTALTLTYALHLLACHPGVQRRLREEVDTVLEGRPPVADDLPALPYTTMVLKETLRLYPPLWMLTRRATVSDEIAGYAIPAGAGVAVCAWATHRHPGFWPDAERFDPERFTPEAESQRHRHAYFPFGAGPRSCIGQHFAMLEAVIALALVAQRYELACDGKDVPVVPRLSLKPGAPVLCRLTARAPAGRVVAAS